MYKIAILFFSTVFATLDNPSYEYILFEQFNSIEPLPEIKKSLPSSNAWVLSLNRDVEELKLRVASSKETREVFGNKQDDGSSYRQPRIKKDSAKQEPLSEVEKGRVNGKAMLNEIMRLINKFALSTHSEPDAHIGDDWDKNSTPTIKLYFKDLHTSLIARAEGREWRYIIPSTIFPAWFYEQHSPDRDDEGPFVNVPSDVAQDFYTALLRMLTTFLSFPV